jgi:hypothetical protein
VLSFLAVEGLWRSPVAHLVRNEGVRGSNPLSSTHRHPRAGDVFAIVFVAIRGGQLGQRQRKGKEQVANTASSSLTVRVQVEGVVDGRAAAEHR